MTNVLFDIWIALVHAIFDTNISVFGLAYFIGVGYLGVAVRTRLDSKFGFEKSSLICIAIFVAIFLLSYVIDDQMALTVTLVGFGLGTIYKISRLQISRT